MSKKFFDVKLNKIQLIGGVMEDTLNVRETTDNVRKTRIQKLADIADKGVNPFKYSFNKNINAKTLQEKY